MPAKTLTGRVALAIQEHIPDGYEIGLASKFAIAVIEECAKVAESDEKDNVYVDAIADYTFTKSAPRRIAAAIRALATDEGPAEVG